MKLSEKVKEQETSFEARLKDHILMRLDGKNFSRWTKDLRKPYDTRLSTSMQQTTEQVMDYIGAQAAYTQSDEITLFLKKKEGSQHFLGGRMQKLCSVTSAITTSAFQINTLEGGINFQDHPLFDCRVWAVEDFKDVLNAFRWRERDAVRNSISAQAQVHFSKNSLKGKTSKDRLRMLREVGAPWEALPNYFKYGTHFVKTTVKRSFTVEELEKLPKKHQAHKNPDLEVERNQIIQVNANGPGSIKNYESFIYEGKL